MIRRGGGKGAIFFKQSVFMYRYILKDWSTTPIK